jgi:hypothetical protein
VILERLVQHGEENTDYLAYFALRNPKTGRLLLL